MTAPLRAALETAFRRGLEPLRPMVPMRLSGWAAKYFYLSAESSYVEKRWEAYPFQVGLMDMMSNDDIVELDVLKSARVGYTKMLLACIGYNAQHRRRNQAVWQPTDDDSDEFCKVELEPMLRDVPVMESVFPSFMQRHKDNTLKLKKFLGSLLHLRGAKAAKNFRRLTLDVGFMDEVDGMDADIEKEGSPTKLAMKRLEGATFPKMIRGSTPKLKGFSMIEAGHDAADIQLKYHVPCPHCGEEHALTWGGKGESHGFKWRGADASSVAHLCPHCGSLMTQAEYFTVWQRGRWKSRDGRWYDQEHDVFRSVTDAIIPTPRHVGVHIWTAYSPQASWPALVGEFLEAAAKAKAGDRADLKTFINTTRGETYEEDLEQADQNALKKRAENYRLRTVPLGCLVLVAGVDVQDNRFEVVVWGFGVSEEMWVIDYMVIEARTVEPREWQKLDAYLQSHFQHAGGQKLGIEAAAIDTGGHATHEVYNYARVHTRRKVFAVKGDSRDGQPIKKNGVPQDVNHNGRIIKNGVKLWFVGTDTAKDLLYGRLTDVTEPGPGYVHFSADLKKEFYEQLTAESRVLQKTASGLKYRWVCPAGKRNEVLDCTVYALFCAHALGLHTYTATMWQKLLDAVQPPTRDLFASGAAAPRVIQPARPADPDAPAAEPDTSGPEVPAAPAAVVRLSRGISLTNWKRG